MSAPPLRLSTLPHTWLIDLDGVVLRHNGYLHGGDELLPGARELWAQIPECDAVIVLSARKLELKEASLAVLAAHGLRVDRALFGLPVGERILINDAKPGGLQTAVAVNLARDEGLAGMTVELAPKL